MPFLRKYLRPLSLAAALLAAGTLQAAPDEDARAAYDRGDFDTAYQIWSELAAQNDGRAQYALGVMHATGSGREQDPVKAFEWFSKAAENGHIKAMYNLGIAYWTGQGTLQDRQEATHWWRMAAERGDVVSQYNLGVAYYNGLGVDQDLVEAARWIRSAAEQNYETAVELLPALESKLRESAPAEESGAVTEVTANEPSSGPADSATADGGQQAAESTAARGGDAGAGETAGGTTESAPERTIDVNFTAAFVQAAEAPVYAVNSDNAPVIDKLSQGTPVKVVETRGGWTQVEAASGFKLWVFGRYVSGDGANARIDGSGVRARSLPSTGDNSVSPGQFKDKDAVTLLKTEGDWKYVQAPPHLHAWVRSRDIRVLDKATESWADRWTQDGGTL